MQTILGPQSYFPISMGSREIHALGNESRTETESAQRRLNEKKPELRDLICIMNQKNAANALAVSPGDPRSFARWIEFANEFSTDFRYETLKAPIPAIL